MSNSKIENYFQVSIFDSIDLCKIHKVNLDLIKKKLFDFAFCEITKLFVKDQLSLEEYKEFIKCLTLNYGKDKNHG